MTLPGPDQTSTHARRRLPLPSERLSFLKERPRPTSGAQAMAEALQLDQVARDEGFADGSKGLRADPQDLDPLAYFVGYWAGKTFGRRRSG